MLYKDFSAELLGLQEVIVTAVEYTDEQRYFSRGGEISMITRGS